MQSIFWLPDLKKSWLNCSTRTNKLSIDEKKLLKIRVEKCDTQTSQRLFLVATKQTRRKFWTFWTETKCTYTAFISSHSVINRRSFYPDFEFIQIVAESSAKFRSRLSKRETISCFYRKFSQIVKKIIKFEWLSKESSEQRGYSVAFVCLVRLLQCCNRLSVVYS